MKNNHWHKYLFEFLSIFVGVTLAFALNNWNEQQRDRHAEVKILKEISNGLNLDLGDIYNNKKGHELAIEACQYFRDLMSNKSVDPTLLAQSYVLLVRDFTSIMNLTGYESLKSKGLEIIQDDELRFSIITLYDYYYQIAYKLEETVDEMQSFHNYFVQINQILSDYMIFDDHGQLVSLSTPLAIDEKERRLILSYLWRIESNRRYKINRYETIEQKINELITVIDSVVTQAAD